MLQNLTYFDVLKKAYYDDEFWRKLIAKPVQALAKAKGGPIVLSPDDQEKLFSALRNFSLVFAFDKYRKVQPINKNDPGEFDDTGWSCKVPWGQT